MSSKAIVLAPSAGGKSTLMRYLRERDGAKQIFEMDEEVMKANNNIWPSDNDFKDQVLVPKIVEDISGKDKVLYLASYVPEEQLKEAQEKDFVIILLNIKMEELKRRNKARMSVENYDDATPWLQLQLDTFSRLQKDGLIDKVVDGNLPTEEIAQVILSCVDLS